MDKGLQQLCGLEKFPFLSVLVLSRNQVGFLGASICFGRSPFIVAGQLNSESMHEDQHRECVKHDAADTA
jgi:hypothetical protein